MKRRMGRKQLAMILVLVITLVTTYSYDREVSASSATITGKATDGSGVKVSSKSNVEDNTAKSAKVKFTTPDNYRSYMIVKIALPAGVTASEITSIRFTLDTKSALALRLYTGGSSLTKSDDSELTYEDKYLQDTIESAEETTEAGMRVKRTKHVLKETILDTTRIGVAAGDKRKVTFVVDDHAETILSTVKGTVVNLGIYAHNLAPSFTMYNLQIKTANQTYDVPLTARNVTGVDGGYVSIVMAK